MEERNEGGRGHGRRGKCSSSSEEGLALRVPSGKVPGPGRGRGVKRPRARTGRARERLILDNAVQHVMMNVLIQNGMGREGILPPYCCRGTTKFV